MAKSMESGEHPATIEARLEALELEMQSVLPAVSRIEKAITGDSEMGHEGLVDQVKGYKNEMKQHRDSVAEELKKIGFKLATIGGAIAVLSVVAPIVISILMKK